MHAKCWQSPIGLSSLLPICIRFLSIIFLNLQQNANLQRFLGVCGGIPPGKGAAFLFLLGNALASARGSRQSVVIIHGTLKTFIEEEG